MATVNTSMPTVGSTDPNLGKSSQRSVPVGMSAGGGNSLDFSTSIQALLSKAETTVQTYQQKKEAVKKVEEVVAQYFPGFLPQRYQNAVSLVDRYIVKANEHYNNVATFEINPNQYWSPLGYLVVYGVLIKMSKLEVM